MGVLAEKIRQVLVRDLGKLGRSKNPEVVIKSIMRQMPQETSRKPMDDLLADAYYQVQHLSSIFAEGLSMSPALKRYAKIVGNAEDKYQPRGLPTSPVTGSFFTTWAFYDFLINEDGETIGSCQLELSDIYPYTEQDCTVLRNQIGGRMGIYEHLGWQGKLIRLRELLTEKECLCNCIAQYPGKEGELWFVRLCKPFSDDPDAHHISMTTPYVLTQNTKKDWEEYLRRTLPKVKTAPGEDALHCLLKYGLDNDCYWHEFIWKSYTRNICEAIYLAAIPDMKSTLPCRF